MRTKKSKGIPFNDYLHGKKRTQSNAVRIKPLKTASGLIIEELKKTLAKVIAKATGGTSNFEDPQVAAMVYLNAVPAQARTGDQIVYKALDYGQDGTRCIRAGWSNLEAAHIGARDVVPVVIHIETARGTALRKLDGVDRLILGL